MKLATFILFSVFLFVYAVIKWKRRIAEEGLSDFAIERASSTFPGGRQMPRPR
jgi:hypothetical protein